MGTSPHRLHYYPTHSSFCHQSTLDHCIVITMSFIAPLAELARNDLVQEKVMEAGRIFFSTSNVTINLLPALVAGALLLLLGLPLLALLFQPAAEYGAPASTYGSPSYSRSDEGYEEFRHCSPVS